MLHRKNNYGAPQVGSIFPVWCGPQYPAIRQSISIDVKGMNGSCGFIAITNWLEGRVCMCAHVQVVCWQGGKAGRSV